MTASLMTALLQNLLLNVRVSERILKIDQYLMKLRNTVAYCFMNHPVCYILEPLDLEKIAIAIK